jgi:hypothetical protein
MSRCLAILALGLCGAGYASLYQPDEPMAVPVGADGRGAALPFDEFKRRYVTLTNQLNPDLKKPNGEPTDRDKLLAQVKERRGKRNPSPDDTAALAADLLRFGNTDEALNVLKPLYDDRQRRGTRTYFVCSTLIHAHALRNEWDQALGYLPDLFDASLPAKVPGWTDAQRGWFKKLDEDYLPHYLMIRKAESEPSAKANVDEEKPTPLFPLPVKGQADPVRFANDSGQYEPGSLAKAERDKLPADALAITQQFLFWFPGDTRLYWLLAELYAADGKIDEAEKLFNEIAGSRRYSNRKLVMEHRTAIARMIEARQEAEKKAAENAMPISLRAVWIYFGVVVVIAAVAVMRALGKRRGGGIWHRCCG